MKTYSINPKTTALLVIDAQNEYFDSSRPLFIPNASRIKSNLIKLAAYARRKGLRAVFVRHCHRADGSDTGRMGDFDPTPVFVEDTDGVNIVADIRDAYKEATTVTKTRYSAFVNTDLEAILRTWGIDTVIVSGLMTQFCCVSTARHAHDLDYKVIFVTDANAGPDLPDVGLGAVTHEEALKVIATCLANGIADLASTAEILAS
jgi:ureidoacrylate peracid hydrolase